MSAKFIIQEVRRLADEFPDCVYTPVKSGVGNVECSCSNTYGQCSNGTVGCIIGQAVKSVGYEIPTDYEDTDVCTLLDRLGIDYENEELAFLEYVQGEQDQSRSWGESIKDADDYANEYVT